MRKYTFAFLVLFLFSTQSFAEPKAGRPEIARVIDKEGWMRLSEAHKKLRSEGTKENKDRQDALDYFAKGERTPAKDKTMMEKLGSLVTVVNGKEYVVKDTSLAEAYNVAASKAAVKLQERAGNAAVSTSAVKMPWDSGRGVGPAEVERADFLARLHPVENGRKSLQGELNLLNDLRKGAKPVDALLVETLGNLVTSAGGNHISVDSIREAITVQEGGNPKLASTDLLRAHLSVLTHTTNAYAEMLEAFLKKPENKDMRKPEATDAAIKELSTIRDPRDPEGRKIISFAELNKEIESLLKDIDVLGEGKKLSDAELVKKLEVFNKLVEARERAVTEAVNRLEGTNVVDKFLNEVNRENEPGKENGFEKLTNTIADKLLSPEIAALAKKEKEKEKLTEEEGKRLEAAKKEARERAKTFLCNCVRDRAFGGKRAIGCPSGVLSNGKTGVPAHSSK